MRQTIGFVLVAFFVGCATADGGSSLPAQKSPPPNNGSDGGVRVDGGSPSPGPTTPPDGGSSSDSVAPTPPDPGAADSGVATDSDPFGDPDTAAPPDPGPPDPDADPGPPPPDPDADPGPPPPDPDADPGPPPPDPDADPGPPPGSDTCSVADGNYCGGHGVSGDPFTLYRCSGGALTVLEVCPDFCAPSSDPSTPDMCF